jgi:hypothetical protein
VGQNTTSTPFAFSHIVGKGFPVVKADAAFASIQLFSLGPRSSFGGQKLGMRRGGYD